MLVQRGGRETVGAAVGEWARSWDCIVADRLQQPARASSEETPVLRLCSTCRGRFTASAINFVARRATLLPYGTSNSLIYPVEENMPVVARVAARLTLCRDSDRASGARRVLTGEAVNEFATGDGTGCEPARRMQQPFLSAPTQRSYLFGCYCWEPRPAGDTPQAHLIASIESTSPSSCKLTYSATGQHATAANTLCAVHR
jgi:hypothetical protein